MAFRIDLQEAGGALGDLGTLLPLTLGAIAVAGLSPVPVLLGFAIFYALTAAIYRLPVPVQPMKAVAAVLLTAQVTPSALAASGVLMGLVLVTLGATGLIDRLGRLVPQSVLAGLQLGLGLSLGLLALKMLGAAPVVGGAALAGLLGLMLVPRVPAAAVVLLAGGVAGALLGLPGLPVPDAVAFALPGWPALQDLRQGVTLLALPQLSLTVTNAVLLTALVAGDLYGPRAERVTPRRLAVTSGLANLLLAPLGALPMCHGAGGVVAHHRFGARSGVGPLLLAAGLGALALTPGIGLALLAAIPVPVLGALLLVAASGLALGPRLFDARPSCRPVIAAAAVATLAFDPFWGLIAGTLAEAARVALLQRVRV